MRRAWFSAYDENVDTELHFPQVPMYEVLRATAEKHPDKTAVHFFKYALTYNELFVKVKAMAQALQQMGLKKGDTVGIILPNCPQYIVSYFAIMMAGGVVVQISPFYTHDEMKKIIKDSEANTIICLDLISGKVSDFKEHFDIDNVILVSLASRLPMIKGVLYRLKLWGTFDAMVEDYLENVVDFDMFIDDQRGKDSFQAVAVSVNDLAVLQYTGGTTGTPKGAMLSHKNLVSNCMALRQWSQVEDCEEVVLAVLPLFHAYGMTVSMNYCIATAGEIILLPRFEQELVADAMKRFHPTFFPGIPTIYLAMAKYLKNKNIKLSSLKRCISGAAPLPAETKRLFEEATGATLVEGYGLSEASPVTHSNPLGGVSKPNCIGVPLPGTDCQICDLETHEPLEQGEEGELVIRGPQIMQGYFKNIAENEKAIHDGWLYTGDIAYMDEEGYFHIAGRQKNMIKSRGLNVYPIEVEEVLRKVEYIEDVAVIGIADEKVGEAVKAFVVLKNGSKLDEKALNTHCREYLAGYKCPSIFEIIDEIPKTMIGKTLYRELRQR